MTANQIKYLQLQEDIRANKAKESENVRSNLAKETETNRSNLENERMAREKWDYEKYGSGGSSAGGVIRTIKAGVNDLSKVVSATGEALKEAQSSVGDNKTVDERVRAASDGTVSVGGLDLGAISKSRKQQNPYSGKSVSELSELLDTKKSDMLSPTKAPRNISSVNTSKREIELIESALKDAQKEEEKKQKTKERNKKKVGKLLGIENE